MIQTYSRKNKQLSKAQLRILRKLRSGSSLVYDGHKDSWWLKTKEKLEHVRHPTLLCLIEASVITACFGGYCLNEIGRNMS